MTAASESPSRPRTALPIDGGVGGELEKGDEVFSGGAGWGDHARKQAELVQKTLDEGLMARQRLL
jgi:hypothetical protein